MLVTDFGLSHQHNVVINITVAEIGNSQFNFQVAFSTIKFHFQTFPDFFKSIRIHMVFSDSIHFSSQKLIYD